MSQYSGEDSKTASNADRPQTRTAPNKTQRAAADKTRPLQISFPTSDSAARTKCFPCALFLGRTESRPRPDDGQETSRRVCTAFITWLTHFENNSVVRFYNSRDKTALCVGQKGSFQPTKDAAPDETQGQTSESLWSKQVNWPFNIKHLLCVSHCARSEALLRRKNSPKRSPWQHLPYIFIGRKT